VIPLCSGLVLFAEVNWCTLHCGSVAVLDDSVLELPDGNSKFRKELGLEAAAHLCLGGFDHTHGDSALTTHHFT
jgi:hypothetical protein